MMETPLVEPLSPTCTQCSLAIFCSYNKSTGIKPKLLHLKRKEILHHANDRFTTIYAIQRGALKTHETDSEGNELIRGLYLKNEVYGYEAIYQGHHLYSSTALIDTVLCENPYQHFLELIRSEPDLLSRILSIMSQQLTAGAYLKCITARQRLSAFLLDLSTRLSSNKSPPDFILPMSYRDIGNYLGLATETISRILSQFKNIKIISIEKKHIYFLQPEELKRIAIHV
jgi:CRP/FNR family transcriptional regulator